jgi:AcrR family transcriptional regulator
VERVATRAGVAKTTVYRRWENIDGLILDLLAELSTTQIPPPDSGDLDSDLRGLADVILALFQNPVMRTVVGAVVSAAVNDPAARKTLTAFFATRTQQAAVLVERAVQRGQLPSTTDPMEVIRTLAAPFYYRMLVTGEPIDTGVADRAAATAAVAARAGIPTATP